MFSKENGILDFEQFSKKPELLNKHVELVVKANSFANQVFPQSGELILGEGGIEFRSFTSSGFIQIPWTNVEQVMVDIVGKHYVHAITISTDTSAPLEFIISKGLEVLRVIAGHVRRDCIVSGPKNFSAIGKRITKWLKRSLTKGDSQ